jgi:hypothetical protein
MANEASKPEDFYIEFTPGAALEAAQLAELQAKSAAALEQAMSVIQQVVRRVGLSLKALPAEEQPAQIEMAFGLNFDAQAGAVLAKDNAQAAMQVKLLWEREARPRAIVRQAVGLIPRTENDD